jgi:hypothetical protein
MCSSHCISDGKEVNQPDLGFQNVPMIYIKSDSIPSFT